MIPIFYAYGFIFLLLLIINIAARIYDSKQKHKKVESPHIVQRIGYKMMFVPTVVVGLMVLVGMRVKDTQMTIVSSFFTLIFFTLLYFIRRKFRRLYREKDEYFFLDGQYIAFQMEYEDIIDWIPLSKQIGVRDGTTEDDLYICINLKFAEPEILFRKLLEMTFAGKFKNTDGSTSEDSTREQELIDFLQKQGYGHIVEKVRQEYSLNK